MSEITTAGDEVRVNMSEARQRLTDLVDMALTGTRVLIMRRNKPVVQLVPAPGERILVVDREGGTFADDVAFEPPPPPPPEERPLTPPRPPRDREVSLAATQAQQRARDRILGNLGGKKKPRG